MFRLCCAKGGVNVAEVPEVCPFPFFGWYACGFGVAEGVGRGGRGGSTVDLIELRLSFLLLVLKILGGDFVENPDRVLPAQLPLPIMLFRLLRPPSAVPSLGAVRGLSIMSSRYLGTSGAAATLVCRRALEVSLCALERCISSSTFGPFPATGYEPLTGGSKAMAESYE